MYLTPTNVDDKKKYLHPTIKPEPIIANLILNSCPDGGIVLDPFSGSGTTCAVAKRLGYEHLGFEINPEYHRISTERLAGITQEGRRCYNNQISLFDFEGEE